MTKSISLKKEAFRTWHAQYNPWRATDGMPSITDLLADANWKWRATKLLLGEEIVVPLETCPTCGSPMDFKKDPFKMEEEGLEFFIADKVDCFKLRCLNSGCRYSRSLFANTMFFNSKKEPNQLLLFFQLWLAHADHVTMAGMLKWTEKTVLQYCQVMHETCSGRCKMLVSVTTVMVA